MLAYFLRLFLLLPLIGGLIWVSLWLWKRIQLGLPAGRAVSRAARVVDVVPLGVAGKLTVVDFGGRRLLIAASRQGVSLIAETAQDQFDD